MKLFLLILLFSIGIQSQPFQNNPIFHTQNLNIRQSVPVFSDWVLVPNKVGYEWNEFTFYNLYTNTFQEIKSEESCSYPEPFAWTSNLDVIYYLCNEKIKEDKFDINNINSKLIFIRWDRINNTIEKNSNSSYSKDNYYKWIENHGSFSLEKTFQASCHVYHTNPKLDFSYFYCNRVDGNRTYFEIYSFNLNNLDLEKIYEYDSKESNLYIYTESLDYHIVFEYDESINPLISKKMHIISMRNPEQSIQRETIPTPYGCIVDKDKNLIYISDAIDGELRVLDLKNGKDIKKARIPSINHGLVKSPGFKSILALSTKEIAEFDPVSLKKINSYKPQNFFPKGYSYSLQGYFSILNSSNFFINSIEYEEGKEIPQLYLYEFLKIEPRIKIEIKR
jgi:hypothetical protein